MLPSERQQKMLELLSTNDFMSIPDLAAHFDISIETVRRDLNILDNFGKISKVYGGVKIKDASFGEITMDTRLNSRLVQKEAIAQKCCEFVMDGDCIFIDSGSTTYHMAKYLRGKKNLTLITNSIPVVSELLGTDIEIILIGGKIRHDERSVISFNYLFDFSQLNIQKAFICAGGVSLENGISDYNMFEATTRKQILDRSKEVIVAADSSKFGKDVTIKITEIEKINCIVTDNLLDKGFIQSFKKEHTALVVV